MLGHVQRCAQCVDRLVKRIAFDPLFVLFGVHLLHFLHSLPGLFQSTQHRLGLLAVFL